MASTMTPAAWLIRLAKLNALVNVSGRSAEKMMTSATRPEHGRQRADVAAADPGDVVAEQAAERVVVDLVGVLGRPRRRRSWSRCSSDVASRSVPSAPGCCRRAIRSGRW